MIIISICGCRRGLVLPFSAKMPEMRWLKLSKSFSFTQCVCVCFSFLSSFHRHICLCIMRLSQRLLMQKQNVYISGRFPLIRWVSVWIANESVWFVFFLSFSLVCIDYTATTCSESYTRKTSCQKWKERKKKHAARPPFLPCHGCTEEV